VTVRRRQWRDSLPSSVDTGADVWQSGLVKTDLKVQSSNNDNSMLSMSGLFCCYPSNGRAPISDMESTELLL
jgi:hypothetical protein